MYGANTAPAGWLVCDGTAVSRTTFANLFTTVSTTFGIGDNATTFNLPDFRGRSPYGVDASQSITIGLGSAGKINVNFQNGTATSTTGSDGPTTHTLTRINYQLPSIPKDAAVNSLVSNVANHTTHTHTIPALSVTHPTRVIQFIIKT
jgi:microcystin-dependent protein